MNPSPADARANIPGVPGSGTACIDAALDPTSKANIGRQVRLKDVQAGGGGWAPGNFGLLALADGDKGVGTYPTHGRFVEMFITQEVRDPPDAADRHTGCGARLRSKIRSGRSKQRSA